MKRLAVLLLALGACREEVAVAPDPVPMTQEALSHFCMMQVADHPGPKAQIHLVGLPDPIFFAQVRDGLAYYLGPERSAEIAAFYVSDMAVAESWAIPGLNNWMKAEAAYFVVGANTSGGMGVPEIAPFGELAAAEKFAASHGGRVTALDLIPQDAVFGEVDQAQLAEPTQ